MNLSDPQRKYEQMTLLYSTSDYWSIQVAPYCLLRLATALQDLPSFHAPSSLGHLTCDLLHDKSRLYHRAAVIPLAQCSSP